MKNIQTVYRFIPDDIRSCNWSGKHPNVFQALLKGEVVEQSEKTSCRTKMPAEPCAGND